MNLPQNKETKTSTHKQNFLDLMSKTQFKIGKNTGTLHFHNETLRHSTGEFSLNRIFSFSPKKHSPLRPSSKIVKPKSSNFESKKIPYKNLIEKTQILLKNHKKQLPNTSHSNPRSQSALRGKSRRYLSSVF